MKPIIFIIGLFSACCAFADSFTVIQDGKEYLCSETSPTSPGQARPCVDKAYAGIFSREESIRLCQGARSTAPAECAASAYAGIFSREESIQLCIGAQTNTGPSDCAKSAYAGIFSREESLRLCERNGTLQTAECAKSAYAGPYSREEAIQLCKSNSRLVLRSLKLLEQSPDVQQRLQFMKK